jgi:hypothetical protein
MIEGKKVIFVMFAILLVIAVVTYILYVSTRLDHNLPRDDEGVAPHAVVTSAAWDYGLTA